MYAPPQLFWFLSNLEVHYQQNIGIFFPSSAIQFALANQHYIHNMFEETDVLSQEDVSSLRMASTPQTNSHPQAKAFRGDHLKILDPSQKILPSLETQRIAGVLEDCIVNMETVALLPAVLSQLGRLSVVLSVEIEGALREHQCLGERLWGLGEKPVERGEGETGGRVRAELESAIRTSVKNVLRLLRANPATAGALRSETEARRQEMGGGVEGLIDGLQVLQGFLLDKLLTSPAEECKKTRYLQEVSRRHGNNMELVAKLETEVAAAKKERDEEISKQNEVIRKLKNSLDQMKTTSKDFESRTQQEADMQSQLDAKTSEGRQSCLQQEANQLRVQLNNLIAENHKEETAMRKKKEKVEREIENGIQKYDADMGVKQGELDDLTVVYEEEKEELTQLEKEYAVLEQEFSQIQEQRHVAAVRKEAEQRELVKRSWASTLIQAFWRGHRVRKAMKGNSKKSSKAKKGKARKGK
ncbi:hypothetical protein UPYG_G00183610 [Umbra pygmaea]|uniref:Dynein regulatory complex protein 10 n=1 Tax=Umbra pygmaea TaxID=75934 RepID=A0ABD0WR69_UMBPY